MTTQIIKKGATVPEHWFEPDPAIKSAVFLVDVAVSEIDDVLHIFPLSQSAPGVILFTPVFPDVTMNFRPLRQIHLHVFGHRPFDLKTRLRNQHLGETEDGTTTDSNR